jgi:N-acetyl-gamma-glutamyl-phosphate reductase
MVSCLDNLVKGAAGQAIQNFNVAFGFDEAMGLN